MSYFPDYRSQTDKLNKVDRAYIGGYRHAIEDMKCVIDSLDDEDTLSIDKEIIGKLKATIEKYMECEEVALVCYLFESDEYSNIELNDEHPMFNTNRK